MQAIETDTPISIRLNAFIDVEDQLRVSFRNPGGELVLLNPDRGLEQIAAAYRIEGAVTLEIKDFFQRGTMYEVYGAILEEDGTTVAAHWNPTGTGQQYTLAFGSERGPGNIRFVIGALPRRLGAAVPHPLVRGGGLTSTSVDPPPQDPDNPPPQNPRTAPVR